MDTFAGLPVHALVVHGAVVLVPLAAIGAILMALRPDFSRRFGTLVVLVAGAGMGASVVAKESGEQLAKRVGTPEVHASLGEVMPLVAAALFVLVLVFWLFDRGIPLNRTRPAWLTVLAVVVVIGGVGATWWTIRVGHSGSESVWSSIIENTQGGG